MTYEKLANFVIYMRAMQESDLDVLTITSSPKGFGKSSFIIQAGRKYVELFGLACPSCGYDWIFTGKAIVPGEYGEMQLLKDIGGPCPKCKTPGVRAKKFNFNKFLAFDNEEVIDKVYDLDEYSPLLADESVRFMMAEDWNKRESKKLKKLCAQMRTRHLLFFANIPKFRWVESKYRDDMATFWVRVLKRGLVILMQPDLGEAEDPWYLKLFTKYLKSYFYFTSEEELIKRCERLVSKHPCCFDYFKVPKVPDDIYDAYLVARNAKVFARKVKEEVTNKELGKIAAWNLLMRWDEIREEIKKSRKKKPTLSILEGYIFAHPKSNEKMVAFQTIGAWIKEISRFLGRKPYSK